MLSTAVETLGFAALTAAAWLRVGLWAALLVAGVSLLLEANFELAKPRRTRLVRVSAGPLTNETVDLEPVALTNGAVEREG